MTADAEPIDLFLPFRSDPTLDEWVGVFATRAGGFSSPPFDSLNLGFSTDDDPERVRANRLALAEAAGVPLDTWVVPGQCHEARVLLADRTHAGSGASAPSEELRGFDAVLLREPGVFALSLSADCPLILIADPDARRGGVAHAGWRGTVAGVVEALAAALEREGSSLERCCAAISPGICGDCYEVGDEVLTALEGAPGASEARGERNLDLRRIHRATLAALGLDPSRIAVSSECSFEAQSRFFSHRRDHGRTGRGGALLGWRG